MCSPCSERPPVLGDHVISVVALYKFHYCTICTRFTWYHRHWIYSSAAFNYQWIRMLQNIQYHQMFNSWRQKQVSRAGASNYISQTLWDVITCPWTWYLRLCSCDLVMKIRSYRPSRSSKNKLPIDKHNTTRTKFTVCTFTKFRISLSRKDLNALNAVCLN